MGFVNKKNTGCSYQTETKPSFKAFLRETGCDLYPIQHISYQKKNKQLPYRQLALFNKMTLINTEKQIWSKL